MDFNRFLPDESIIENSDFTIYGNDDLDSIKGNLLSQLSFKKIKLLNFFRLNNYSKVIINLFNDQDAYIKFSKQFIEVQPYSYGNLAGGMINCIYDKNQINKNYPGLVANIIHEYIRLLYRKICKNKFDSPAWLEEGLAEYLSEQFIGLENNDESLKVWTLDYIFRRDREIPKIDYLKKYGFKYGEFADQETNKYNGYAISYLLVKYLFDNYNDVYSIISNKDKIDEIEPNIIEECMKTYDYDVKENIDQVNTPIELLEYMNKNLIYGWIDKDNRERINNLKNLRQEYKLQSIEEIEKNRIGTCIEQTLLEKNWFDKHNIENKIFCYRSSELEENNDKEIKMHCFLVFYINDNWYLFEHCDQSYRGIVKCGSLDNMEKIICGRYKKWGSDWKLTEFDYPKAGIDFKEFNEFINEFDIEVYKIRI